MADDILARARAARRALDAVSYGGSAESAALQRIGRENTFIREARVLMPELEAEVERLRSYKSLPDGMVWQDYASPDDVCKIREPLDAEIERLRQEVPPCDAGCATEGLPQEECSAHGRSPAELWQMREAAIAERDAALAEVECLREALNQAEQLAEQWAQAAAEKGWRKHMFADELRAVLRGDQ